MKQINMYVCMNELNVMENQRNEYETCEFAAAIKHFKNMKYAYKNRVECDQTEFNK